METIRNILNLFDVANYLPDLGIFAGVAKLIMWLLMLIGPVLMLVLGFFYYAKPPAEANFSWGFRTYFGMGSVEVWRFTQKLAGRCWMIVGGLMTAGVVVLGILMLALNAGNAAVMALWCVGFELVAVVGSWLFINIVVLKHYDKDGNPRSEMAEEEPQEALEEVE